MKQPSSPVWAAAVRCLLVGIILIIVAVAFVTYKKQANNPAPPPPVSSLQREIPASIA